MSSELETLVNDMLLRARVYIPAIQKRAEALAATCQSASEEEAEVLCIAASEAAQKAHDEYYAAIQALHAAREKR